MKKKRGPWLNVHQKALKYFVPHVHIISNSLSLALIFSLQHVFVPSVF